MSTDPEILARRYFDRWMLRALGVGLYNRPVWRRETGERGGPRRARTGRSRPLRAGNCAQRSRLCRPLLMLICLSLVAVLVCQPLAA